MSDSLIPRYDRDVRTVTATTASRGFSELLDAVERGEVVSITRAGAVVAEIRPAAPSTGRRLREALAGAGRLDDEMAGDIAAARALAVTDERDPWGDG